MYTILDLSVITAIITLIALASCSYSVIKHLLKVFIFDDLI